MSRVLMVAAALQMVPAVPARTAPGVFIDDDPSTPGRAVFLPDGGPHPATSKPEKMALAAVDHLIHNEEDAGLAVAKVVTIEATNNAKQTPVTGAKASTLLSSCHTSGVAQLDAISSVDGRKYVLVKVDFSKTLFGSKSLVASVGIENSAVKTVFLNVGPLLVIQVRDPLPDRHPAG